jgi:hypothetical protein
VEFVNRACVFVELDGYFFAGAGHAVCYSFSGERRQIRLGRMAYRRSVLQRLLVF